MDQSFELNPPEIRIPLIFKSAAGDVSRFHVLRPPKMKDWIAFDGAVLRFGTDSEGRDPIEVDIGALVALWDALVIRVEGYPPCGEQELMTVENWKELIDSKLKADVANQFKTVFANLLLQNRTAEFSYDRKEVPLVIFRGDRPVDCPFSGQVHVFSSPQPKHLMEFDRIEKDAKTQRTGSGLQTVIPPKMQRQIALYDELIIEARGYTLDGHNPSRSELLGRMDAQHKIIALIYLFRNPDGQIDFAAAIKSES